jgi:short-subunit dehydrogenase
MGRLIGLKDAYGPMALVTGASDGIGRALAVELAREGLDLVLVARRKERLDALAAELGTRHGITVHVMPADLADPTSTSSLVEATRSMPIRLFVHAAGFGSIGSFLDLDRTNEVEMVDLNCRSVVDLSHVFGGRMRDRGEGGGIVLFGSLVGFQGAPMSATYAATKGFVQSFAEALAVEMKASSIAVLSVAPGPVATGFASRAGMAMGSAEKPETVARQALAALGRRTTVRPGLRSKFLGWSLSTLPRPVRVRILGKIMGGMRA